MGNHIRVGCRCTILKGSNIPDNTIIAANSLMAKEYQVGNCIIGGNPARLLRTGIEWDSWNCSEKFSKEERQSAKCYSHEPTSFQMGP
jgi:acetyltransferase-like isoleucine patch superfamily enzyme